MNKLCTIDGKRNFTTTLVIAEGIGTDHASVYKLLKTYSNRKTLAGFKIRKVSRGGRPQEYAELTELQASFLITLMRNTERVVDFKEKLNIEFARQKEIISELHRRRSDPNWQNVRKDGKHVYFKKTDVIKEFVEYATAQGSKNAKFYYANLANLENKALFFFEQKYPNVREVLTIKQLMMVSTADDVVEKALKDGMEQGLNYKDCYKLAKQRIMDFAAIVGRSPVVEILGLDRAEVAGNIDEGKNE